MTKHLYLLLLLTTVVSSCSEVNPLNQFQDIAEVQWKADGSGMLSLLERANGDIGETLSGAYSPYILNSDGGIQGDISTDMISTPDMSYYTLFMNDDGKSAIAQLNKIVGTTIKYYVCRIDHSTGQIDTVLPDLHLIASSPDGKYLVGSYSPPRATIKTVTLFDISGVSPRKITQFDVDGIDYNRGIFLSDGSFGVAVADSIGKHINIYDTTGALLQTIANAGISGHNIHFNSNSKNIYFRNNDGNLIKQNIVSDARATIIAKNSVQNFDVAKDESVLVYSILEMGKGLLYKHSIGSGTDTQLADDVVAGAYLSPLEDKVAYKYHIEINHQGVKVIPFSK
jgi:hypothetical protein